MHQPAFFVASVVSLFAAIGPPTAGHQSDCAQTVLSLGFCGDHGRATAAKLAVPYGVARDRHGRVLIADSANNRIRRVSTAGVIVTIAGSGLGAYGGDGGPASAAALSLPTDVAPTGDGGYLIADSGNNRVRRVFPGGTIQTVAGNGTAGFAGDGGPATQAELNAPTGVAPMADGGFLVADNGNNRVRAVSRTGVITTLAGDGASGFAGDGGPASLAELHSPTAVAVWSAGQILIADSGNDRVRAISSAGIITTVAGSGRTGLTGDGGSAVGAGLSRPTDVAALPGGGFLIADTGDDAIRRVAADGTIGTAAGTGVTGFSGDGAAATSAQLAAPAGVAAGHGDFLVADTANNRVRAVLAGGRIVTIAGSGAVQSSGLHRLAAKTRYPGGRLSTWFDPRAPHVRRGARIRLRFVALSRTAIVMRVVHGRRTVVRHATEAFAGLNQVTLAPIRPGRYIAQLFVKGRPFPDDHTSVSVGRR